MAALGLLDREPDLIVSGINLAAIWGTTLPIRHRSGRGRGDYVGIPPLRSHGGYRAGYDLSVPARFAHRLVSTALAQGFPAKTLLNVNCPDRSWEKIGGVRLTLLGKRIYGDKVEYRETKGNRRGYHIYNDDLSWHQEPGTDFEAIAEGWISITPLHFDLMSHEALDQLRGWEDALHCGDAD
jgi:5'-nucleotidase